MTHRAARPDQTVELTAVSLSPAIARKFEALAIHYTGRTRGTMSITVSLLVTMEYDRLQQAGLLDKDEELPPLDEPALLLPGTKPD